MKTRTKRRMFFDRLARSHGADPEAAKWIIETEHKLRNNRKMRSEVDRIIRG